MTRWWLLAGWIAIYAFGVALLVGPVVDRVRARRVRG